MNYPILVPMIPGGAYIPLHPQIQLAEMRPPLPCRIDRHGTYRNIVAHHGSCEELLHGENEIGSPNHTGTEWDWIPRNVK